MPHKGKTMLTISWYVGLTAFVGGWLIFLTWTACRYLFAFDFDQLELVGFFWMVVFFWLCLLALALLIIYVLIHRKQLHKKMLYSALMILINIPSVLFILDAHSRISNLVFVKLDNHSGKEFEQLMLKGKYKSWKLEGLSKGSTLIFNYDPDFFISDARSYSEPDSLKLFLQNHGKTDTLDFPKMDFGACHMLVLDKKLKLHSVVQ
jgi:hypothetical protein